MEWLEKAQHYLRDTQHDLWVVYDFQASNPIAHYLLGYKPSATRRYFLIVPAEGMPIVVGSVIDKFQFTNAAFGIALFKNHAEMSECLRRHISGVDKVYMDYSPNCDIPHMSKIDLGTMEFLRSLNSAMSVDSSADLFQYAMATWSPTSLEKHLTASKLVADIKTRAFDRIFTAIENNVEVTEYDIQQFILGEFARNNLFNEDGPTVAINANSADSHYRPPESGSEIIKRNDWVLIDLWAKLKDSDAVYSDITWVSFAGDAKDVPPRYSDIFDIVKGARERVVSFLRENVKNGIEGWQADKVARDYITNAGYGEYFNHRTGHSMAPGKFLHALSVNLDNYEMKDTRKILPGVGFSIEPGIYLDNIGVRLEVNAYIDENHDVRVTSCIQDAILTLDRR